MTERLNTLKSVYCYYFPEVRPIVRTVEEALAKPEAEDLFLTQTPAAQTRDILRSLRFSPELDVPVNEPAMVTLDTIHEAVLDRVVAAYAKAIPSLKEYTWRYPTSGSSEGIFHLLSNLRNSGVRNIYIPRGEYEGYREYGKEIGIDTTELDLENTNPADIQSGVWFISNPSARDGNIIPNNVIHGLCEAGHRVILDLAYVGSTKDYAFDVSHKNIQAVFLSWSKPYGLFRFRIGATFSRTSVGSLYANKWFKDVGRVLLGLKVVEEIGPHALHPIYKRRHKQIIDHINTDTGLGMRQSDALLLGYLNKGDVVGLDTNQIDMIKAYERGDKYRFCVEPYYEIEEKSPRSHFTG